jgi:hypothetical protein
VNRLWVKLSLAFLGVSLAAIGVVALLSAWATSWGPSREPAVG